MDYVKYVEVMEGNKKNECVLCTNEREPNSEYCSWCNSKKSEPDEKDDEE